MLFNSLAFLIFAPTFFILYFNLNGKIRLSWCILASYFFYAWWDWRFVGLIMGSTLITFYSARGIRFASTHRGKKLWLFICLFSHILALCFFKYLTFLADSLKILLSLASLDIGYEPPRILLPVGISFYTFTALSYIIDVYNGRIKQDDHNLLHFAAYQSLFPQLLAGPIIRATNVLPQLKVDHPFDFANLTKGLEMICWGYLLKLCLADNCALFVDPRFNNPELFNSTSLMIASLVYAFQIYGDFAGYSFIAIGLARIMGYDFGINFNKPYVSQNFSEFWQRWHVSLSSWIRDYIYIPLGGSRFGKARTFGNLLFAMFLAGLWHGAGWNFIVWGILHGIYLILQRIISKPYSIIRRKINCPQMVYHLIEVFVVFIFICIAWIFFRASDLSQAFYILSTIVSTESTIGLGFGGMKYQLIRILFIFLIVFAAEMISESQWIGYQYRRSPVLRGGLCGFMILLILFTGNFSSNKFIYFQF